MYWSVFGAALGHRAAISHLFLVLGVLTAIVGALFCFRERHVKRLLAFSTVSHAGMFLAGFALLTPSGWRARRSRWPGTPSSRRRCSSASGSCCTASIRSTRRGCTGGAVGCVSPGSRSRWPGWGWPTCRRSAASSGRAGSTTALERRVGPWLAGVSLCARCSAGAVLRVAFGVFYGLGDPPSEDPRWRPRRTRRRARARPAGQRTPLSMLLPCCALVVFGLAVGVRPWCPGSGIEAAAVRFQDQAGDAAAVLHGVRLTAPGVLFRPARPRHAGLGHHAPSARWPWRSCSPWRHSTGAASPCCGAATSPGPAPDRGPALPERRHQRLHHLARHRRGRPRRRAGPHRPLTRRRPFTCKCNCVCGTVPESAVEFPCPAKISFGYTSSVSSRIFRARWYLA